MIGTIERIIDGIRQHQPTAEEKAWGMLSSIRSGGSVGTINKLIARICHQKDADVMYWIKGAGETFTP